MAGGLRDRPGKPLARRRTVVGGMIAAPLRALAGGLGLRPARARASAAGACDDALSAVWQHRRRSRVAAALHAGFGVQYWGDGFATGALAAAPHGLLIIETAKSGADLAGQRRETLFSPADIRQIDRGGTRPVLGYLNLAKIETYRNYWVDAAGKGVSLQGGAEWIGPSLGADGVLARFWTPGWQAIVEERVDLLMQTGVSGLFLDDILQYFAWSGAAAAGRPGYETADGPQTASDFAAAMMRLVRLVAARARRNDCGAIIVVNNGAFIGRDAGAEALDADGKALFDGYREALDGILMESVLARGGDRGAITALQEDYEALGIPVMAVDFLDSATPAGGSAERTRQKILRLAERKGFAAYVAEDALFNRLYAPVPMQAEAVPAP